MATSTTSNKQTDDNWLGENAGKLPTTLNVLTWLTFIANGLGFCWAFVTYARAQASYDAALKAQDALEQAPEWARKMAGPHPAETARAMLDNRLPILIITLLASALCFLGALQMRQLKKVGFTIYILGDVVGFLTGIFIGFDTFLGFGALIGIIIVITFIILYATQLKAMK